MVAVAGNGWVLAPTLVRLMAEVDGSYPRRSKASDGSIGDSAHSARTSDHNPSGGMVHAVDITEDHANGPNLRKIWNDVIARRDGRVKYLIYEGQIVKSYRDSKGVPAWTPQRYTGSNPHDHHLHVSIRDGTEHSTDRWLGAAPHPVRPASKPKPAAKKEDDDMAAIVLYFKAKDGKGYPYRCSGAHAKLIGQEALNTHKYLRGEVAGSPTKAFGNDWQQGLIIVDGPCQNVECPLAN